MKIPKTPLTFEKILSELNPSAFQKLFELANNPLVIRQYLHWDKLQHHKVDGYTTDELWAAVKFQRSGA